MKRLSYHIIALATAMLSAACSSLMEEQVQQESDTVTASIGTETRTAIGPETETGHKVVWSEGDRIIISAGTSNSQKATYRTASHGSATASFIAEDAAKVIDFKGGAIAGYPVEDMYLGNPEAEVYFTIPSEQNYVEGSFDEGAMPMISDVAYEPVLNFHNAAGVLRINLSTGLSDASVEDITIISPEYISGECGYIPESGSIFFDDTMASSKIVSLRCGGVKLSSDATPFYIVVPHQTYKELSIRVTTTDGKQQTFRMKSGKEINVKRSTISTIPLVLSETSDATKPRISLKIESVTFDDINISLDMKNVTSYYCGLQTKLAFTRDLESGYLIESLPYSTSYTSPYSYTGKISDFQTEMEDILIEAGQSYVIWFAAYREDGNYSEEDIVYAETMTKSFTSGGTTRVTYKDMAVDMTSISVTLSAGGAKFIYCCLLAEEDLENYITEAQKIDLLLKAGGVSTIFDRSEDILVRKFLRPGATMVLLATAIDRNGKYGPLLEERIQTDHIPYNSLTVKIDKDIDALRSTSTIKWDVTNGEAAGYIVFFRETSNYYWTDVFGRSTEMVQEKMYLDSGLFYFTHTEEPSIQPGALDTGHEYIAVVAAIDSSGNISQSDSWIFTY